VQKAVAVAWPHLLLLLLLRAGGRRGDGSGGGGQAWPSRVPAVQAACQPALQELLVLLFVLLLLMLLVLVLLMLLGEAGRGGELQCEREEGKGRGHPSSTEGLSNATPQAAPAPLEAHQVTDRQQLPLHHACSYHARRQASTGCPSPHLGSIGVEGCLPVAHACQLPERRVGVPAAVTSNVRGQALAALISKDGRCVLWQLQHLLEATISNQPMCSGHSRHS
jgi:hypothetical protein